MKIDYSFYLIIDEEIFRDAPFDGTQAPHPSSDQKQTDEMLFELIDTGITCVQLRIKNKSYRQIRKMGEIILAMTRYKKIPLIINDYVEIAKTINAEGVHLGLQDTGYKKARKVLGYNKIIGFSIANLEEAKLYRHLDVDYFGVGPIFPTTTKLDAAQPIAVSGLKQIMQQMNKPVVAIGGINEKNLSQVLLTGVAGIAVSSAVLKAAQPLKIAQIIAEKISTCANGKARIVKY